MLLGVALELGVNVMLAVCEALGVWVPLGVGAPLVLCDTLEVNDWLKDAACV